MSELQNKLHELLEISINRFAEETGFADKKAEGLDPDDISTIYSCFVNFEGEGIQGLFAVNFEKGLVLLSRPSLDRKDADLDRLALDWTSEMCNRISGVFREELHARGIDTLSGPPVGVAKKPRRVLDTEGSVYLKTEHKFSEFKASIILKSTMSDEVKQKLLENDKIEIQRVELF